MVVESGVWMAALLVVSWVWKKVVGKVGWMDDLWDLYVTSVIKAKHVLDSIIDVKKNAAFLTSEIFSFKYS